MTRAYLSGDALSLEALRSELAQEPPGLIISRSPAPNGLLIVEEFMPPTMCARIAAAAISASAVPAGILSEGGVTVAETRRTEHLRAADVDPSLREAVRAAFHGYVRNHFQRALAWFEDPVILRYGVGGEYLPHADAYNWSPEENAWRRVVDRDFSLLIYLNDDFEGGALEFKYFDYKIAPRAGLMVALPSDWRYAHAAHPVTKGQKLSIVSFAAAEGTPRVLAAPPPHAVRF
jgi:predicted 2-oxoglutarate/Fe(II)-dependent dioxygenase YbiX